ESDPGLTIVRIDAQCVFEHRNGSLHVVLARPSVQDRPATDGEVHRIGVRLWRAATFDVDERDTECLRQATRDTEVVLGGRQRPMMDVDLLGPEMRTGARVDELRVDADRAAHPAYAALQHVADFQLAAELPGIDGLALERERSVPGNHEAAGESRQIRRQIFRHAIGEVILVRIVSADGRSPESAEIESPPTTSE